MTPRIIAAVTLLAAAPMGVHAVNPSSWVHTTEAEFAAGENDKTVVTNLGDIKLAAGTETAAEAPEGVTIFNDAVAIDGTIYLAAGPEGRLLRKQGDEIEEVFKLEGEQAFALAEIGGRLVVAISAEGKSRLAALSEGKLVDLVTLPEARYVWDILLLGDDAFLATGSEGQVFRVPGIAALIDQAVAGDEFERPEPIAILDAQQANVLCLAADGEGRLYAGTDTDGLVYRLTPTEEEGFSAFVIYDAPEPEIGALLVLPDGTVYAGTADAEQAKPGRLAEAASQPAGRPEVAGEAPATPEPEPGPGEGPPADAPEPGDLPQVPPKAPPIGEPEDGGDGVPGQPPAPAPPGDPAEAPAEPAEPGVPAEGMVGRRMPALPLQGGADAMPDGGAADAEPAQPTPEQYDRLRAVIRARMEAARKTGVLQVGGGPAASRRRAGAAPGTSRSRPPQPQAPPQEGNAVYRIDPQGFVTQVFRESVMILDLVEDRGRLLIATGSEGQLFAVDPNAEETVTVADLDAEQIPSLLVGPEGDVMLVTANPAQLLLLSRDIAEEGTYTGPIMDAQQVSLWGNMGIVVSIPDGTRLLVQTRSGNVADPEQAPWSAWTDGIILDPKPDHPALQPREVQVQAPPARFLQYKLILQGGAGQTPVVDRVESSYVTPNLRPRIATLTAAYPEAPRGAPRAAPQPEAPTAMNVTWEAADPNNDTLLYRIEYQPAGSDAWITLVEDHAETSYEWQTRRVPDGRYVLRLTASDSPNNPPDMAMTAVRLSDPVLVDNTPPTLSDIEVRVEGTSATLTGHATDNLSRLEGIAYVLDSGEQFQPILPRDLIFDSTTERWAVTIPDLSPGPHVVTLRVRDRRGNTTLTPVLLQAKD